MDKTNNKFITYLKMFFNGFCLGVVFSAILYFGFNFIIEYRFTSTITLVLILYWLYRFSKKFDFNTIFGLGTSTSPGLMIASIFWTQTKNPIESLKIFGIVFFFCFMNFLIMKLVGHTFIMMKNKNKKEKP